MPDWSPKGVQAMIRSVLEAYYEPQFSDSSHGCRPHRGCQTALTEIHQTWLGTKWFIEGDIKAGYCEEWTSHPSLSGSPQGGIASPILSNIYMDRFDKFVEHTRIPA